MENWYWPLRLRRKLIGELSGRKVSAKMPNLLLLQSPFTEAGFNYGLKLFPSYSQQQVEHECFVFKRYPFSVLAGLLTILIEVLDACLQLILTECVHWLFICLSIHLSTCNIFRTAKQIFVKYGTGEFYESWLPLYSFS
jgi:hypothetical protein